MKSSFALSVFSFLFTFSSISQESISIWEQLREQEIPEKISLTIDGDIKQFRLEINTVLSKEIRATHPEIMSFNLVETSGESKGKLTLDDKNVFIYLKDGAELISMQLEEGKDLFKISRTIKKPQCGTEDSPQFFGLRHEKTSVQQRNADNLSYGDVLRTYRLAIIGTGEFTENNGGTTLSALTIATNTVNGINLIFENEASITMTIVESQFYTNASTDPFTPDQAGGDSRTNQAAEVMAMNFSNGDYDIGHVFHFYQSGAGWGAGGIAGLGVVCDNGTFFSTFNDADGISGPNKSAAWSGSFSNIGNSWIQLAAHEFGHQFDALHTFNGGGNNNCNFGISSTTAYEIGSGTTIMSYNGLCPADQNVPGNGEADNYFHSTSLDRIANFVTSVSGDCSTNSANGNTPPEANANLVNAPVIPIGTPFELMGTATDSDGDALNYHWEQIDEDGAGTTTQGFIGSTAANSAIAPLFKSVPPSDKPNRTFPELSAILNGTNENLSFEALPQINRDINFSFVVRDNQGGVSSDNYTVTSSDSAGPFRISSQNSSTSWTADGAATASVTWDVSNTDNATINCQEVEILLSTDNGMNFNYSISNNTTNDGEHTFTIPNLPTSVGRIKIKSVGNIFFDINDAPIEINSSCEANGATFGPDTSISAEAGDPILDLTLAPEYGSTISSFPGILETSDFASSLAANSGGSCVNFNGNTTYADAYPFQVDASGSYTFSKQVGAFGFVIHVYEGEFVPSSPCTNWLIGSYNSSTANIGNSVTTTLSPGIDYTLVMSSFSPAIPSSLPAAYTIIPTGAGNVVDGALAPTGFDYLYVAVDDNDSLILEISSDLDLTGYSGGDYTVYGLSSLSSQDLSSYINASLASFEANLLDLTICGNLSTNSLPIQIIGLNSCPGDFDGDGFITVNDLTPFLASFGCGAPDVCVGDFTGDGNVTVADLTPFLASFGSSCN